jgi:hypothetical protein
MEVLAPLGDLDQLVSTLDMGTRPNLKGGPGAGSVSSGRPVLSRARSAVDHTGHLSIPSTAPLDSAGPAGAGSGGFPVDMVTPAVPASGGGPRVDEAVSIPGAAARKAPTHPTLSDASKGVSRVPAAPWVGASRTPSKLQGSAGPSLPPSVPVGPHSRQVSVVPRVADEDLEGAKTPDAVPYSDLCTRDMLCNKGDKCGKLHWPRKDCFRRSFCRAHEHGECLYLHDSQRAFEIHDSEGRLSSVLREGFKTVPHEGRKVVRSSK